MCKFLTDTTVQSGECAIFEIELTKGDARVTWFHDDVEIVLSERVQLAIDGKRQRLVVMDSGVKDAGVYSCRVGLEEGYSSRAKLTVVGMVTLLFFF